MTKPPASAPRRWEALAPEQRAFLDQFSSDYVTGKKWLCRLARGFVAVGALCAAVAGIAALINSLPLRGHG